MINLVKTIAKKIIDICISRSILLDRTKLTGQCEQFRLPVTYICAYLHIYS